MKKDFLSFPRDAKIYLISQFLMAGYFTWPFWYGFATERIAPSQFGVYLAATYIVGMIAEVPTGAFADNYGRKRSAVIGALGLALIPIIVYVGGNFPAYLVAAFVGGIASAFVSGSLESLIYELPGMDKSLYRRIQTMEPTFWQSGLIIATATGGLMYRLNHFLPFAVQVLSFLAAAMLISHVSSQESRVAHSTEVGQKLTKYLQTNIQGFRHLFEFRKLWPLIVFGSTLGVVIWACIENVNEAAMIHYTLAPSSRGLLIACSKILAIVLLNAIIIRRLRSDAIKLTYLGILSVAVFAMYSMAIREVFLVAFVGFNMISSVMTNFIRPIIHDHVLNKWRATALSAYSFVCSSLQAGASLLVGILLQQNGVIYVQRSLAVLLLCIAIPACYKAIQRAKQAQWS